MLKNFFEELKIFIWIFQGKQIISITRGKERIWTRL